jgi:hypothetical protein
LENSTTVNECKQIFASAGTKELALSAELVVLPVTVEIVVEKELRRSSKDHHNTALRTRSFLLAKLSETAEKGPVGGGIHTSSAPGQNYERIEGLPRSVPDGRADLRTYLGSLAQKTASQLHSDAPWLPIPAEGRADRTIE